ncbi:MAG: response regulator, partial [Betaproteobacteria bacterium]
VTIAVSDNGIGIRPEALSTIFQMFSRAAHPTRHSAGLGIGLGLANGLVELHGGTITAESAGPGTGSRFVVRLPLVQAGALPEEPPAAHQHQRAPSRRILVADDNVDAATTLGELLRLLGHQVETAYDGEDAIRMFTRLRPDTVLLDIGMPKKNGYEVARWIRAQPGGDEVLLAAITGWGQAADKACAEQAGFNRHLTKPVDVSELMALLAVTPASPGATNRAASNM